MDEPMDDAMPIDEPQGLVGRDLLDERAELADEPTAEPEADRNAAAALDDLDAGAIDDSGVDDGDLDTGGDFPQDDFDDDVDLDDEMPAWLDREEEHAVDLVPAKATTWSDRVVDAVPSSDGIDEVADDRSNLEGGATDSATPSVYAPTSSAASTVEHSPAPVSAAVAPAAALSTGEAGFDRERLLDLVDGLERDIALVEGAMSDIESGDDDAVDAALAALASGSLATRG